VSLLNTVSRLHTFLWGYLKENLCKNNPYLLDELKQNFQVFFLNVKTGTPSKFASNIKKKLDTSIAE
jgi:hypothetical protein